MPPKRKPAAKPAPVAIDDATDEIPRCDAVDVQSDAQCQKFEGHPDTHVFGDEGE